MAASLPAAIQRRPGKCLAGGAFCQERGKHVALVDQADHAPARIDHRQLGDVGGAHAREHGAQIVLRTHDNGRALAGASDHDIAHGSRSPTGWNVRVHLKLIDGTKETAELDLIEMDDSYLICGGTNSE
jgi:hypothetical protein